MGYKVPDGSARRVRVRKTVVMDAKALREFKKEHPEYKGMSLTQFNKIVKQFHEDIVDEVIDNPNGVMLPRRLGRLIIVSCPTRHRRVIDFGASNKAGEKVYHANHDTDNRLCKLMFVPTHRVQEHLELWRFKPTQAFTKKVSRMYRELWPRYFFLDFKMKISQLLR